VKEEFVLSFENKIALVTGVGSGMGLATAKAFAEAGASVALVDLLKNGGLGNTRLWRVQAACQVG